MTSRRSWWRSPLSLTVAAALAFYALFVARARLSIEGRTVFTLFDDGMISMRYARNLALGEGLRWNPGEPPVEGFSNLLWVLAMAAVHRLGVPDEYTSLVVSLLGIAILVAVLWLVARLADVLSPSGPTAKVYAVALTATFYPLTYWTLRGMEVGLVALLTMLLLLAAVRGSESDAAIGAAAIGGLVLTRDDGMVPAAAILVASSLVAGTPRVGTRTLLLWSATLIASKGGHLAWRWWYYGDLFPNTYYLKLTGVPLGHRVMRGLVTYGGALTRQLAPIVIFAAFAWRRRFRSEHIVLAAPFVGMSAYSIMVGGDAWEHFKFANRYLTSAVPPLCVLGGLYLQRIHAEPAAGQRIVMVLGLGLMIGGIWDIAEKLSLPYVLAHTFAWGIVAVAIGALLLAAGSLHFVPRVHETNSRSMALACMLLAIAAANGRPYAQWLLSNPQLIEMDWRASAMGLALRETTQPDASIAVYLAGSTPYFAGRHAIDLLGKNDRYIARLPGSGQTPGHDKIDLEYSFGLRPDVVVTLSPPEPGVRQLLEKFGYQEVCRSAWVRQDSVSVDRPHLAGRCVR